MQEGMKENLEALKKNIAYLKKKKDEKAKN